MLIFARSSTENMILDAHCHYVDLKREYEAVIAAVSVDFRSSLDTLSLNSKRILKGVGIHPWRAHIEKVEEVLPLVEKADFVGEVGLDYRLSEAPREVQRRVFQSFLFEDKTLNVHALDAWEEALSTMIRRGVRRAILHWYTGSPELLKDIEGAGYFITVNPSITFQRKHQDAVRRAPPGVILMESDGGYVYRGILLEPNMIPKTEEFTAELLGLEVEELHRVVEGNFRRAFNL
jgi:TatD DNase family protein